MSVIQSFKKRQLKKQVEQKQQVEKAIDKNARDQKENEPENIALSLLAKLLNVAEQDAISEATKYVESNITFFGVDPADGEDKSVLVEVTTDDDGNITHVESTDIKTAIEESAEQLSAELSNTADTVQSAASDVESAASDVENSAKNVNSAASNVEDAASDLAYSASDIVSATEELKEAASDIKKPSEEEQKSSSGEKASKQKKSSKK